MASVAFYIGLPEAQREEVTSFVKKRFIQFFNIQTASIVTVPNNRFLPDLSKVDEETAYYFNQITRYSENSPYSEGPIYKWNKNIQVYLYGNFSKNNKQQVIKVIKELNRLIYPRKITLVKNAKRANSFMYFGSLESNNQNSLSGQKLHGKYFGHFHILSFHQEIQRSYIFINTADTSPKRQKHIIREELTQSLGFINDSYDYPESIFYQEYSDNDFFSELDQRVIRLLYE
jgi:hypothetical protein